MGTDVAPYVALLAGAGIVGGIVALGRGFAGYRAAARIADTASSTISSLAIGEVRVSGTAEPAELTLVSPLQSATCLYYRSSIVQSSRDTARTVLDDERSVGFRVRDATGSLRVFPRGAEFDVPARFSESTGLFGEEPAGLRRRSGPAMIAGELDRAAQVAALLTVHQPTSGDGADGGLRLPDLGAITVGASGQRRYSEARIEPGEVVTVIGRVLPFDQLPEPDLADVGGGPTDAAGALADPEIAADLAQARASGSLAADAASAWGNAAIPGFGIGRPVSEPALDPRAAPEPLATADEAGRSQRMFDIRPDELVLAAAPDAPLLIALGAPGQAVGRQDQRFLLGLLGAILAIGSAVVLAIAAGDIAGA